MDVLFPRSICGPIIYDENRLRLLFEEAYRNWYDKKIASEPKFVIENVRFEHDPHWRNQFFSLTCAREGNHWFWRATKVAWAGMGGAI